MNVLTALPWRKPPPCRLPRAVHDAAAGDAAQAVAAGCGWFDSSHDLASGLQVREFATAAAVPGDALPAGDWLALQLAGCPAAARSA